MYSTRLQKGLHPKGILYKKQELMVERLDTELEIDEHLHLQEKGWVIQKFGWAIMVAVMIAGGLGLFGEGVLSTQTIASGPVKVNYEKYYRYETEMKILLESSQHISSISFPQKYLKDFKLVRFVPEPENNYGQNNDVQFNFLEGQNQVVSVYLVPKSYGAIGGIMKVNGANTINLHHFIFP